MRKSVRLTIDGYCIGNPGPGGWVSILRHGNCRKEIYGSEPHTTNNRMELRTAVEGLRALKQRCNVEITTDSGYVKNGITNWIQRWKRNGWWTSQNQPVANQNLWRKLDELVRIHNVKWNWTKGHPDNILCRKMASIVAARQISTYEFDKNIDFERSPW